MTGQLRIQHLVFTEVEAVLAKLVRLLEPLLAARGEPEAGSALT